MATPTTKPRRPYARSVDVPASVVPTLADELAKALGADAAASKALHSALAGDRRFRVVVAVHRADGKEFTDEDTEALRALRAGARPSAVRGPARFDDDVSREMKQIEARVKGEIAAKSAGGRSKKAAKRATGKRKAARRA